MTLTSTESPHPAKLRNKISLRPILVLLDSQFLDEYPRVIDSDCSGRRGDQSRESAHGIPGSDIQCIKVSTHGGNGFVDDGGKGRACSTLNSPIATMTVSPLNYKAYRLACNVILPISRRSGLYCIHLSATKDFPSQRRHASTRTISTAIVPTNDGLKLGSLPLTWQHTGWTEKMLLEVVPSHRKPRTFGDKFAWKLTRVCRSVNVSYQAATSLY